MSEELTEEMCANCFIPRSFYDLKAEPSIYLPDYTMPKCCQGGHIWIKNLRQRTYTIGI